MKKFLGAMIMAAMSVSILTACGDNGGGNNTQAPATTQPQEQPAPPANEAPANETPAQDSAANASVSLAEGQYATGLGIVTSTNSSRINTDTVDGRVQVDSSVATITVDSEGIIVAAVIDAPQTRVYFDEEGNITTDLNSVIQTKGEQGPNYGMLGNSGIDSEWYEQADAFANWLVGQSIADARNIGMTDNNRPEDADLASSVTISISSMVESVERAINNLVPFENDGPIRTGMGIASSIASSRLGTDDVNTRVQVDSAIISLTIDSDNIILAASADHAQSRVEIYDTGQMNPANLSTDVPTKGEQGAGYGMLGNSGIGKEWYEQAEAFAEWMIGRSVDEVLGIAVTEDNRPADADLASSVTISISLFMDALERAVADAQR